MAHLPSLIGQAEFEARAKRSLADAELAQFEAFAQDASALIRQAADQDFMSTDDPPVLDAPEGIIPVAFRVIDRAIENRLGLGGETTGNYTWRKDPAPRSAGVYLTPEDEADIRSAVEVGQTGFAAVTLSNFDLPETA